jgi:hypothetical protein
MQKLDLTRDQKEKLFRAYGINKRWVEHSLILTDCDICEGAPVRLKREVAQWCQDHLGTIPFTSSIWVGSRKERAPAVVLGFTSVSDEVMFWLNWHSHDLHESGAT